MPRIHSLPAAVVNRIAAGEVVERPASVVKELLENAIDAAPTRIDVAVERGGTALIRVADDGVGIESDDLPLAISPHATSKLRVAEDLERIETLGFRGEALASIGAVARLVLASRSAASDRGAAIEVDSGRVGRVRPEGRARGTVVEVHELFGQVPARRAFLRAPATEWSHCAEAFVRTALAHPQVAFSLSHNGRLVHDLPPTGDWRERIAGLFGRDLAARLIDLEVRDGDIVLQGLVGRPEDDLATGRLQHFFVGGRPFRDRTILHAVQEGYRGVLLSGRQPMAFLRFDMPPTAVDVNVHPAKMEVRFREPDRLHRLVCATLRRRFLESDLRTALDVSRVGDGTAVAGQPRLPAGAFPGESPAAPGADGDPGTRPAPDAGNAPPAAFQGNAPGPVPTARDPAAGHAAKGWGETGTAERAVQMHGRYIVVETAEGIEVIDQHALHERVLYQRLRDQVASGGLEVQPLLIPEIVELGAADLELVRDHGAALARAGLRVDPFGGVTVIVTGKPALVGTTPGGAILEETLGRLKALSGNPPAGMIVDEVLHGLACRAAVKAGDPLRQAEVDALVGERHRCIDAHHCPHGRPTSLTLSRQELDRQFRRT
ncbi:MAG: DNA mismatch repair endonuclease MutL [Planctomycetia bacterium]|nr:DNA mismatch repair endonuclease MutL [Planctomycetia bacterium]